MFRPGGLVDDLGDALGRDFADPAADVVGCAGQVGLGDGLAAARGPRGGVGAVERDEVLVMDREVAILRWGLVDGVEPHVAGWKGGDIAAEFVGQPLSGPRAACTRGELRDSPSASSVATARPLGPSAEMRMGTSIGRGGACPPGCIMRIGLPCQPTVAPPSGARSAWT
jgi:hypothetical protein